MRDYYRVASSDSSEADWFQLNTGSSLIGGDDGFEYVAVVFEVFLWACSHHASGLMSSSGEDDFSNFDLSAYPSVLNETVLISVNQQVGSEPHPVEDRPRLKSGEFAEGRIGKQVNGQAIKERIGPWCLYHHWVSLARCRIRRVLVMHRFTSIRLPNLDIPSKEIGKTLRCLRTISIELGTVRQSNGHAAISGSRPTQQEVTVAFGAQRNFRVRINDRSLPVAYKTKRTDSGFAEHFPAHRLNRIAPQLPNKHHTTSSPEFSVFRFTANLQQNCCS